jgi:hypothetical protein
VLFGVCLDVSCLLLVISWFTGCLGLAWLFTLTLHYLVLFLSILRTDCCFCSELAHLFASISCNNSYTFTSLVNEIRMLDLRTWCVWFRG